MISMAVITMATMMVTTLATMATDFYCNHYGSYDDSNHGNGNHSHSNHGNHHSNHKGHQDVKKFINMAMLLYPPVAKVSKVSIQINSNSDKVETCNFGVSRHPE